MLITKKNLLEKYHVAHISRQTRVLSLILIAVAMIGITANFYLADAVYAQASVLPFYILFFILLYVASMVVEYLSLWCERGYNFHCTSIAIHSLALILVTYEMGAFYGSGKEVYSNLPSYSFTSGLSNILVAPSAFNDTRI